MPDTLFDDSDPQSQEQQQQQQSDNFLSRVVTAKGETWNDPNVLAKGYLSAQEHIERIEAENAQLREKATKNDYMKEVLERIESGKAKPVSGEPNSQSTNTQNTNNQGITVEQIKGLVAETLTEQEARRTAAQNIGETKRLMQDAFGTEASTHLKKAMEIHGMSKERMDQLAAESPTAFMALLGKPVAKERNTSNTSTVNTTSSLSNPQRKDWAYWQKMRRENPKEYRTAQTQKAMLEARESMSAEEFYGTA